jgi:hypothetical protein
VPEQGPFRGCVALPEEVEKRRNFLDPFLRIVLAKCLLASGVGFGDCLGREGLADRNQGDLPGRAPGDPGCLGNTCFNSLQAGCYCCHNRLADFNVSIECSKPF